MNSVKFRSIAEWDSALLMLPENSFFTLMRSVFGNIKTPFNKQKLIHDLTVFLSKKEIQETIKNYIDKDDHRVIAAIGILEEPFPGELESFFGGEYSYADLQNIVLNLEERLIIYRFKDEEKSRLALNPVLAPILKPLAKKGEILFPSGEISNFAEPKKQFSLWEDSILACLISFIYDQHDLFKNQGGIRKKNLDEGKQIFPRLELEPILGTFRVLGLIQFDEMGKHHIDENCLNQLTELSEYERKMYLASAMKIFIEQGENIWQYFNKNHILTTVKKLHQFLQNINPNRIYPYSTIHKIFKIQNAKGKDLFDKNIFANNNCYIELSLFVLQSFGLIEEAENKSWKLVPINHSTNNQNKSTKSISMDSPNSFVMFPEIGFADAIKLARFSSVVETGTVTRFTLTKDSAVRAYRLGMTSEEIITVLKNLSETYVDQNFVWQLKDWEKRYLEVSLNKGIVLSLSKERLYLANTEPLVSMIAAELASGIFLLNIDDEDKAENALQKAGVDIIARNNLKNNINTHESGKKQPFFLHLNAASKYQTLDFNEEQNNHKSDIINLDAKKSYKQKDHFKTILAKMKITKDQRDELAARIERRLILTDEQMDASSVKFEKLEARGLDYVGKYNIAKQAISSGALLEVAWSDDQGNVRKIVGIPSSINKVNGEAILVIHSEKNKNNQDDTIRITLGRISLLRRIKQSIFGV